MKYFSTFSFVFIISLFSCSSSAFSQNKFSYWENFWGLFNKNNTIDNEDNFFKIADSAKLIIEKKTGFFPQEYRYFQYDLKNQKYNTKKFRKAIFHYMRGLFFFQMELPSKAFEEFQISLNLFQEIDAHLYVFDCYMISAIANFGLKDSITTLKMIDNAKKQINKIDNDTARWDRTAVLNWNYGKYYLEFNDLDKAKFHLDSARRLIEFLTKLKCVYQVEWNYYLVYMTLSKYYVKKGILDSALAMNEIVRNEYVNFGVTYHDVYKQLFKIYKLQGKYKNIIAETENLLQNYQKTNHFFKEEIIFNAKLNLYDDLADAYYNIGEKDKAYQILKELNELNVKTRENIKPLQAINAKFELEGKLKEEELTKKYSFILFFAIMSFLLILGLFFHNRYRKIRKLNLQLNELNDTKNRLFSIISHDLRSPILSMNQLLDKILSNYENVDNQTKHNYFVNMHVAINNVAILLENLLNWSQFQIKNRKGEKQTIQIHEAIQSVINQTNYLSNSKDLKINLDCIHCTTLIFNQNEFEVIIRNLLTNAIKFSPTGGKIEIRGENNDDTLTLEIIDEGAGINPQKVKELSNGTSQKSSIGTNGEKGAGLGLFIVKDILARNNGKIEFLDNNPSGLVAKITIKT
jgi:signal transduction histidine kinase